MDRGYSLMDGPHQRQIPRCRKSDTPSDLRFLFSAMWDLPLECLLCGIDPWSAWESPLECVGFASGVVLRGICLWSAWDLPLELSDPRGIDL